MEIRVQDLNCRKTMRLVFLLFVFFFQAEDGIRDLTVTGVQTCALPIFTSVTFLPAVIYLATLVTAAGAPAIHLRVGHSVFLPGFYLPLQLYFFFKAFKTGEWKYVLLASIAMALMVFNGGTHILPMSVAALGSFAICAAIGRRDWRPVAFFAMFGIAAVAYSAPKLLPVAQFVAGPQFWDTRNPIDKPDLVTLEILKQTYLVPTEHVGSRLEMQRHGWHEYGNYIGAGSAVALAG